MNVQRTLLTPKYGICVLFIVARIIKHGKTNSYAINFDITTERRTDINSIISIFIMAKMHEMLNGLQCPCEIKKSNDSFNETRSGRSSIVSIFRLLLFSLSTVIIISAE